MLYGKTLAGKLNPDLKANLNGHPFIFHSISFRSELGSKSYIFIKNDKIISLTNLFQHLLFAEILLELKIESILAYLVRNFQINARNKLTTKCLLTFFHYKLASLNIAVKSM